MMLCHAEDDSEYLRRDTVHGLEGITSASGNRDGSLQTFLHLIKLARIPLDRVSLYSIH